MQSERENTLPEIGDRLLVELVAQVEMHRPNSPVYTNDRFIALLDRLFLSAARTSTAWSEARINAAAARLQSSVAATRLHILPRDGAPSLEPAPICGTIPQVLGQAARAGAAPYLALAAAAGAGRDLWDETCEEWVRLPDGILSGSHVVLPIFGDSMTPALHTGDAVLVRLGPEAIPGTVVLARGPDGGYVVKHVERITRARLHLTSANSGYSPIVVPRSSNAVIGTVVLRWRPHDRE